METRRTTLFDQAVTKRFSAGQPARLSALVGQFLGVIHRRAAGDSLAVMSKAGLTMPQLVTLHMLVYEGGRSVGGIARCLRLSAAATSHLIDRLVRAKLVARTEDPGDRRQKKLNITAAGRSLIERLNTERTREISQVLTRLSPTLRQQFGDVLERVIAELASLPEEIP